MNLDQRISAFARLGTQITSLSAEAFNELASQIVRQNPWFTPDQVRLALDGIGVLLQEDALICWVADYPLDASNQKTVGVAMAGNIPGVGFHDFLCVLIAGHRLKAKLSTQDSELLQFITRQLLDIEPGFRDLILFSDRLLEIDAMIATGSDNTARYFEYYFRNIPHIIRKNRSSCAVILGEESETELKALGKDVFSYFGLGCRNVSKLYVPETFNVEKLFQSWKGYAPIINHHKYFNNYEYQKAILLVNKIPFFDNGFVLIKEDASLVSPISVLYHEQYADQQDLREKLQIHSDKIQCVVSARKWFAGSQEFGRAQFPKVSDYADQVDTLAFLSGI